MNEDFEKEFSADIKCGKNLLAYVVSKIANDPHATEFAEKCVEKIDDILRAGKRIKENLQIIFDGDFATTVKDRCEAFVLATEDLRDELSEISATLDLIDDCSSLLIDAMAEADGKCDVNED